MWSRAVFILVTILLSLTIHAQSVFSEGAWHKIGMVERGIYRVDRNFLVNRLGIDVTNVDARTIKLYGFNGGMLPQENSAFWYRDPPEIPMLGIGLEDGSMDPEDYLLFYAESPHKTTLNPDGSLDYETNLYSDTAYYFLTYGGENAKQFEVLENQTQAEESVGTFNDYLVHEVDETNILNSGREWYGEDFGTNGFSTLDFDYNIVGVIDSVGVFTRLISQSRSPASFDLLLNQSTLGRVEMDSIPSVIDFSDLSRVRYTFRGAESYGSFSKTGFSSENLKLTFKFNKGSSSLSKGNIDYFILGFERSLRLYGNQTMFRTKESTGKALNYDILATQGNEDVFVWEITNPVAPKNQQFQKTGSMVSFNSLADENLNEYIIFSGNQFSSPIYFGRVGNQNIKGETNVDGVIIAAPLFMNEAERLASFHETHDGLSVKVVSTWQIYNEFSSGRQDISAIRNYLKYLWENGNRIKYALLMGDASYDYKNRVANNTNHVPVYESRQSFHRLYSHSSDDYFGFLEEDEGYWDEGILELYNGTRFPIDYVDHTLEIGVGRLPVKTRKEANDVVNKIIRYATSANALGKWRSEVVYMADDGDGATHMRQAETINQIVRDGYPEFKVTRLFLDDFEKVEYMQNAFHEKLADGALVLDFLGHGSPSALMQRNEENRVKTVITIPLLDELKNRHRLPLFVTATCDFGKYDNPIIVSGAENMILNPNGGAIALLTTTRAVFSSTNLPLNMAFQEAVFSRKTGSFPRLGDIARETKNNSLAGPINRNFSLIGDPMLKLNYPEYDIIFNNLETEVDTLSALERVTISGQVMENSRLVESFGGTAILTVLDVPRENITIGLDNNPFAYDQQANALFRGEVTVSNGLFEASFIVPKNSSYNFQNGKINAYASNDKDIIDAFGASRNFVLGGTANADTDTTPPKANVYLNEPTFKNGDIVGTSSLFIAELSDENGINISTNGFGQSLQLTLNDQEPILLNDFYTASLDDFKNGTIVYPLQNLAPGRYNGELKVWDVYNNSSIQAIEFTVSDKPVLHLYDVMNYPNPISINGRTTFTFEHDRIGEELIIRLDVFDANGKKVNSWNYSIDDSPRKIDNLTWDFMSETRQPLRKGIYFYKLEVSSTLDGARASAVKRMIIN